RGHSVHALYSGSGSPTMYGIQLGAGSAAVDSNLVQGVASAGHGTVYGMYLSGSTIPTADNVIHSLGTDGTGTTSSTVEGLQVAALSSGTLVERNLIHSLHAGSTAAAGGNLIGLYASGGAATYVNNLVRLGIDKEGNAVARGTVHGIYHTSGTSGNNYWHNSVHVGGSAVEGSGTTAAFYSGNTPTRNVRNNIFHNA